MEYLGTEKPVNKIQPVVSVCITTYNHEAFIAECLDSILMQETDFPYEIIVGEDDSKDSTREICMAYAEKHPDKIRLFLRDENDKIFINGKKTGRFNFVSNLEAARGDFIALCDGDDYWITPNKLQIQKEAIKHSPGAVMAFSLWNDKLKTCDESKLKYKIHNKKGEFDNSIAHTSSLLFKNKTADLPALILETTVGDRPLINHILNYGHAVKISPPLSYYRKHDGGVWTGVNEKQKVNARIFDLKILYKHNQISLGYYLKRVIQMKYPKFTALGGIFK